MLLLGIDLGTSSVKISVYDPAKNSCVGTACFPETEAPIHAAKKGWAEQDPETWWQYVQCAIQKCNNSGNYDPKDICAIGVAFQMHGLVIIDKDQHVLRPSIIWCDSRAVNIGKEAYDSIGPEKCLSNLLNAPGNFTASKLAWVKYNEPESYKKIDKVLLPGDFIAMKLSGVVTTTIEALSEGVFWDFRHNEISNDLLNYFEFDPRFFPKIQGVFSTHGFLTADVALKLDLRAGIPISYKSGDQPNNALSLNVMHPGEVAATAGTSGVIYGVTDQLIFDKLSRINTFAHVNYSVSNPKFGILLCINGAGIMNKWTRNLVFPSLNYAELNDRAMSVPRGACGLKVLPFGNGAERMLKNKIVGGHLCNVDFNQHTQAHLCRGVQEGIAFAFRYGIDIMKQIGIFSSVVRAGIANLFKSDPFVEAFVNTTGISVQLYDSDGSTGAAIGSGIGAFLYNSAEEALKNIRPVKTIEPEGNRDYENIYQEWLLLLEEKLKSV